jgi:hypothetical protein
VSYQFNPLTQNVPEVGPHERGKFFTTKTATPIVKTQFGANKTGVKSDTAFHPVKKPVVRQPGLRSAQPTEKVISKALVKIPSFSSPSGRWQTVKRSVV